MEEILSKLEKKSSQGRKIVVLIKHYYVFYFKEGEREGEREEGREGQEGCRVERR